MAFRTVAEALDSLASWPQDRSFVFQDNDGRERGYTFVELEDAVARRAKALQELGLAEGERFGLIVVDPGEFVITFLAGLRIKRIPVPLYPPLSMGSLDAYTERTAAILAAAGARLLLTDGKLSHVLWGLVDQAASLERLVAVEKLQAEPDFERVTVDPDDLAFLQYTSGSTSDPKGVMVTHGNLLANATAIFEGLAVDLERGDKGASWLPLYHDMGLIGCVVTPVVHGIPMVFIPTLRFIKRPKSWFDVLHRHRATLTFAPNFAYALMARKARDRDLDRWDLSHVRVLGCGAEPIHPRAVEDCLSTYARCGLRQDAFLPAYGLAEATLAVTFKPVGTTWRVREVDAQRFQEEGTVEPPTGEAARATHVSCGTPIPGLEVAIRMDDREVPEGVEGEICVRGESVSPGYFQQSDATAAAFRDGWLHTGDLGYLLDGELYVTGRLKDLIILNGRNLHPQSIEWAAMQVDGVRKGNVVAFSRQGAESEELVLALETRAEDHTALAEAVKNAVQHELGVVTADVVCLDPGVLPKTSSGKLQRAKTRQQYLAGTLGKNGSRLVGGQADRLTLARHVARSVWSRAKASVLWR